MPDGNGRLKELRKHTDLRNSDIRQHKFRNPVVNLFYPYVDGLNDAH